MPRRSLAIPILIAIAVVLIDQITKSYVMANFVEGESKPVIGEFLYFQFIMNEGGAMGTRIGPSWVYTVLSIAALVLIARYFVSGQTGRLSTLIALALISGGAVGNLIDRLRFGKVVDFIDMDIPDIGFLGLYRWYTYNVADAAISVGLIVFIISLLIKQKPGVITETSADNEKLPEAGGGGS